MNALVNGRLGFIGSHIAERLSKDEYEIGVLEIKEPEWTVLEKINEKGKYV